MLTLRKAQRAVAASLLLFYISCCLAAFALYANAVWPSASGEKVKEKGSFVVDLSHAENGCILARSEPSRSRLKLRIAQGETIFTYDLNSNGEFETFPLQMGSGSYTCSLYKNIKGNKYSQEGSIKFSVELNNENAAFLCPNQYVNYNQNSPAVALSDEICAGLETDQEKFKAIRDYIKKNFLYDFVKAATAPAGMLPDIDACLETRMGICQDLTALAACMLRVQGIPAKLVIGYADQSYHAWNSVLLDGEYVTFDVTADLKGISSDVVYTVERCY